MSVSPDQPTTSSTAFENVSKVAEYEEMFKNRYTAEDEEYVKGASVLAMEPVMIVPWNAGGGGRGGYAPRPDNRNFNRNYNGDGRNQPYNNQRGRGRWNNYNGGRGGYNRGGYNGGDRRRDDDNNRGGSGGRVRDY